MKKKTIVLKGIVTAFPHDIWWAGLYVFDFLTPEGYDEDIYLTHSHMRSTQENLEHLLYPNAQLVITVEVLFQEGSDPCMMLIKAERDEASEVSGGYKLMEFEGYTVDFRVKEFRKFPVDDWPEFIGFKEPRGKELLKSMMLSLRKSKTAGAKE